MFGLEELDVKAEGVLFVDFALAWAFFAVVFDFSVCRDTSAVNDGITSVT